jgi:cupin 2 domain-containing protein
MKQNIFQKIPKSLPNELFEEIICSKNIKIERIISHGHLSKNNEWYDQKQNEWVLLLEGEACLEFENREVILKSGDYINIPSHSKHRVAWTSKEKKTIWLVIFYD